MLKTDKINMKKRYFSFIFLVLVICVLGMVFSVSYAYISGSLVKDSSTLNPYVQLEYYYNDGTTDYKIDQGGITGAITSAGVVSLSVRSGSTTKTITINSSTKTFSLPIKIKNAGNVDGEVLSISASLTFKNGDTIVPVDNSYGTKLYFLQMVSDYTLTSNSIFELGASKISLTKQSGNAVQILSGLKVSDNIASSDCCGKNFVLNITAEIAQKGLEDL